MVLLKATALVAVATLLPFAAAHSWVEQMMVINGQGSFTGNPGYARNATARTAPGFSDPLMVHILPGQGQPAIEERDINSGDTAGITPTDPMCKKTQQSQIQGSGLPRLSAAPGSLVALRYQENGHVTLPQNQPGKPPNRGTVYIYGTTEPKTNENFLDVFGQWNADGTGGDKRGKLIATQPYDDGVCYQVNSGDISQSRQKQYPHTADQLMGADLWCQNDIKLPSDAVSGKPYTLYWVWDWPTAPGADPNLPKGKAEIYTTCMDVDITAASKRDDLKHRSPNPQASGNAALNSAAIKQYMTSLIEPIPAAASTPPPSASSTPVSAPPASSRPPPASTPPASPSAASAIASTRETAMNPSVAASIVEAAVNSEISSIIAAQAAGVTVTVTPRESTVTVTAEAHASSAYFSPSSSLAIHSSHASLASSALAASSSASSVTEATPASAAGTPPSSMDIQSPVIHASSSAATTAPAISSRTPASSGAALSISDTFSGTAYPANASPSASMSAGTPGPKCKKVKRSRILGRSLQD